MPKPPTRHFQPGVLAQRTACGLEMAELPKSHLSTVDPRNATCRRCKRQIARTPTNQGFWRR